MIWYETNNPMNIRFSSKNKWLGLRRPNGNGYRGFCEFENIEFALRAAMRLINNYILQQCSTVKEIITRYAPSSDNNPTFDYINFVCDNSHFLLRPETIVAPYSKEFYMLVSCMCRFETGCFMPSLDSLKAIAKKYNLINQLFPSEI